MSESNSRREKMPTRRDVRSSRRLRTKLARAAVARREEMLGERPQHTPYPVSYAEARIFERSLGIKTLSLPNDCDAAGLRPIE